MKEDHVISEYEFKKIFGDLLQVFEFSECFYRYVLRWHELHPLLYYDRQEPIHL
jgi:hypothetical protein